ncbi:MAG: hypothetical protein ACRENC_18635 [Gemmatimonadaceae bacterium]
MGCLLGARLARGGDRVTNVRGRGAMIMPKNVLMVVRHDRRRCVAGAYLAPTDHERDVDRLCGHRLETRLDFRAFSGFWRVALDRLVHRRRDAAVSVESAQRARGGLGRHALGSEAIVVFGPGRALGRLGFRASRTYCGGGHY